MPIFVFWTIFLQVFFDDAIWGNHAFGKMCCYKVLLIIYFRIRIQQMSMVCVHSVVSYEYIYNIVFIVMINCICRLLSGTNKCHLLSTTTEVNMESKPIILDSGFHKMITCDINSFSVQFYLQCTTFKWLGWWI